jgi:RNA polymerase sigma-70 factor (ECF subfamily)
MVELATEAVAGNKDAFGELARNFYGYATSLALTFVKNQPDAEEVAQAAVVTALDFIRDLRQPEAFQVWFRAIVISASINFLTRRRRAEARHQRYALTVPQWAYDPAPYDPAEHRALYKALAFLEPHHRRILKLFYFDGYSLLDLAAMYEKPIGTIKRRLWAARQKLRSILEGRS